MKLLLTILLSLISSGLGAVSPPQWVPCALEEAADDGHGYSFDNLHGDPDYICTSFVYHMLERGGLDLDAQCDGDKDPSTDMSAQMHALESLGFERTEDVDFATLPIGSVVYACTEGGLPRHVEIYIGTFDVGEADECGNPPFDVNGTPLTCGARITDRDPAPGDQLQDEPCKWLGGEVGAFEWDSRGEDYWSVAYMPPEKDGGTPDGNL